MADRTFKVYGQAYAESGDVTATLTVGGVQVFNGAVNDSTTVRSGQPTTSNHLFSFTLDENTTGNLSYSLAVSGGELCLGQTQYNGAPKVTPRVSAEWLAANLPDPTNATTEQQSAYADQLTEAALGTTLYNALKAGELSDGGTAEQQAAIKAVFNTTAADWDNYYPADDVRASATLDGESMGWSDDESKANWVIIGDGQTFACTWNFSAESVYTDA